MKQVSLSFLHGLTEEEKLLAANIGDKISFVEEKERMRFTGFLSEHEAALARQVIAAYGFERYIFYGGYEDAKRVMLGLFPTYDTGENEYFPMTPITFFYRSQDKLTHRDFLGALMGAGLKRDTVGDILVGEGKTCVFLVNTVIDFVIDNVSKVGNVGVSSSREYDEAFAPKHEFKYIKGTVASLRADSVIALATRSTRAKASEIIYDRLVFANWGLIRESDEKIEQGNSFYIRGYGKYVLESVGNSTKKNRLFIEIKKFI